MHYSVQIVLVACLIAFGVYRRVRRSVGWQKLRPQRMVTRSFLLGAIGVVFLVLGGLNPVSIVSDVVGILLGILLGYVGASLTRFEHRGGQWQYLPNPWLGSLVIVLFICRLAYRLYEMFTAGQNGLQTYGANPWAGAGSSSWASGFTMIMFAYYIAYAVLLLRSSGRVSPSRNG